MNDVSLAFFIFLIIDTVWHLVYENIIKSTIHFVIQNRLFSLRDQIRRLRIAQAILQNTFDGFEEILTIALHCYTKITPLNLFSYKATRNHATRKNHVKPFYEACIYQCNIESKLINLLKLFVLSNSGAWSLYPFVYPLIVLYVSNAFFELEDKVIYEFLLQGTSSGNWIAARLILHSFSI